VQGLTRVPAAAAFVTAALHAPVNWLLIYGLGMGWKVEGRAVRKLERL
jgi:Na+-driven multidrug efflux pump